MLTGRAAQPRRPKDTPKTRYYSHVRAGSSESGAVKLTAESYGLPIYQTGPAGPDWTKPIVWTLAQIEGLLFTRYLVETGRIGGPDG